MAQINYLVTKKPKDVGRLGTQQSYVLKVISKFNRPTVNANRNIVYAMDYQSAQGTYLSDNEEFTMDILYYDDEIADVDELLYSLFDCQTAQLDGTDIPKLGAVKNFKLTGQSWATEAVGCNANRLTLNGTFLP